MTAAEAYQLATRSDEKFIHPDYERIQKWIQHNSKEKRLEFFWLSDTLPNVVIKKLRSEGFSVQQSVFKKLPCYKISWKNAR